MELTEELLNVIKNITMCKVISSNISAIGYNKEHKILKVIFSGNNSYVYFNVEPEVYEKVANAESKGRALNENVTRQKEKYKYIKL